MNKIIPIKGINKLIQQDYVNNNFNEISTSVLLVGNSENGEYVNHKIKSVDFQTHILETDNGKYLLIKDDHDIETLSQFAEMMNCTISQESNSITNKNIVFNESSPMQIKKDDTNITLTDSNNTYSILNMYFNCDQKSTTKKDALEMFDQQIEEAPLNGALPEEIENLKFQRNDIQTRFEHFSDNDPIYSNPSVSFVVRNENTNEITMLTLNNLEYSQWKKLTEQITLSNEIPDISFNGDQFQKEFQTLQEQIKNKEHICNCENLKSKETHLDDCIIRIVTNQDKQQTIQISGNINGEKFYHPLNDNVTAILSDSGLRLHIKDKKKEQTLLITSIANNMTPKTPEAIFEEICKNKGVSIFSDTNLQVNKQTLIMEKVESLGIEMQYTWTENGIMPQKQYFIAGHKINKDEALSNIYASDINQFIAIKMGQGTKIIETAETPLVKSSEKLKLSSGQQEDAIYVQKITNQNEVSSSFIPDYVNLNDKVVIHQGVIYELEGPTNISEIGGKDCQQEYYINPDGNKIERILEQITEVSEKSTMNWDIVSEHNKLYLITSLENENGQVETTQIGEIQNLELNNKTGLLKAVTDKGETYLSVPSSIATEKSIYKDSNKSPISMQDAISQSSNHIISVVNQINNSIGKDDKEYQEITNPKEIVRDVPENCFVSIGDKLYYKEKNLLYSNTETKEFSEVREQIDVAFSLPKAEELKLLNLMSKQYVYIQSQDEKQPLDGNTVTYGTKDTENNFTPVNSSNIIAKYEKGYAHTNKDIQDSEFKNSELTIN